MVSPYNAQSPSSWHLALPCIAALALMGCGDSTDPLGPPTTAAGGTTSSGGGNGSGGMVASGGNTSSGGNASGGYTGSGGSAPSGYPAAPYGNELGNTFPFLNWQGYFSTDSSAISTNETWRDYSADDLRNSGKTFALIHTSLSG